jgi:tetratricopeptide (TPR) repeat protein
MLAIAGISGVAAFSASVGAFAPDAAVRLWPPSGAAYANAGTRRLAAVIDTQNPRIPSKIPNSVASLSRKALLLEPTNTVAMRNLALYYDSLGNRDRARGLMEAALASSRRNSTVNLWLTEDLSRKGQNLAALRLYDITIRTDSAVAASLMQMMARSLANQRAVPALEQILVNAPPWMDDFWTSVLSEPSNLDNAYALRERLHKRGLSMAKDHDALLIAQLANSGRFEKAFALYHSVTASGPSAEMLVDGGFDHDPLYPPIGWKLAADSTFGSALNTKTGQLEITALPNSEGVVAQQLVELSGNQDLVLRADYDGPGRSGLALKITCAGPSGEQNLDVSFSLPAGQPVRAALARGCPFAWVSLVIERDDNLQGRDIRVDSVSMRRST